MNTIVNAEAFGASAPLPYDPAVKTRYLRAVHRMERLHRRRPDIDALDRMLVRLDRFWTHQLGFRQSGPAGEGASAPAPEPARDPGAGAARFL